MSPLQSLLLVFFIQHVSTDVEVNVKVEFLKKKCDPLKSPPATLSTPPMGWNSWNAFGCNLTQINESKLKENIDILTSSGLASAGYKYFNIDDCWLDPDMTFGGPLRRTGHVASSTSAPRNGTLRADPKRFTDGSLATLSSYAHSKGLQFGTYLDAGLMTCQGYAGSLGYEEDDAKVLESWEVDYLKLDVCEMGDADKPEVYTKWSHHLNNLKHDIVFSCSYPADYEDDETFPESFDWATTQQICNLWRLYTDVSADWNSLLSILEYWAIHGEVLRKYHSTNGYNDPDMLEVGNGNVTIAEGRTQMSIWAILAAPLILGNDLTEMTDVELGVLTNEEVIAVNQDSLVIQGKRIMNNKDQSIWIRQLHDQSIAIGVINLGNSSEYVQFLWNDIIDELKFVSHSSLKNDGCEIKVRDLWARVNLGENGVVRPKYSPRLMSPSKISSHGTFFIRAFFNSNCLIDAVST